MANSLASFVEETNGLGSTTGKNALSRICLIKVVGSPPSAFTISANINNLSASLYTGQSSVKYLLLALIVPKNLTIAVFLIVILYGFAPEAVTL